MSMYPFLYEMGDLEVSYTDFFRLSWFSLPFYKDFIYEIDLYHGLYLYTLMVNYNFHNLENKFLARLVRRWNVLKQILLQ